MLEPIVLADADSCRAQEVVSSLRDAGLWNPVRYARNASALKGCLAAFAGRPRDRLPAAVLVDHDLFVASSVTIVDYIHQSRMAPWLPMAVVGAQKGEYENLVPATCPIGQLPRPFQPFDLVQLLCGKGRSWAIINESDHAWHSRAQKFDPSARWRRGAERLGRLG